MPATSPSLGSHPDPLQPASLTSAASAHEPPDAATAAPDHQAPTGSSPCQECHSSTSRQVESVATSPVRSEESGEVKPDHAQLGNCAGPETNPYKLSCRACDCCIVQPGAARRIQKEIVAHIPIPSKTEVEGCESTEILIDHWVVGDQYDFDNVGVSRPVRGAGSYRYLLCAECDRGPIGIQYDADPNFYVFNDRVAQR